MKKRIIFTILISFVALCFFGTAYADTTVHLDIETSTGALYNQDIAVAPCDSDNAGTMAVTAYCAVLQSGLSSDWSWYGTDAFLNSIGTTINNNGNNNIYWGWFGDLTYGETALSAHTLTSGEHILLNYDINPLKLSVSNWTPTQHDTVTLTLTQFGLDSNFNPLWTPASSGSVTVNGTSQTVASDGTYTLTLDSATPYIISGDKTGFIDSNTITLRPTAVSSGGGGGAQAYAQAQTQAQAPASPVINPSTFSVPNAVAYLESVQSKDGSFGESDLYTDWAGIALSSTDGTDSIKANILNYMSTHNTVSTLLTDNERHAMALLALSQNPYSFHSVDYITTIANSFDGTQFGDPSLVNDDIFALIPLASAGYKDSDEIITKDIAFIISKQKPNGSWEDSADITAAAIQALEPFSSTDGVFSSITNASSYLQNTQGNDGGWGNVSSTSWALQAQSVLSASWVKGDKGGKDYLAETQAQDGGMLTTTETLANRIWATSYAIPAMLGKPWSTIMQSVPKPIKLIEKVDDIAKVETVVVKQPIVVVPPKKRVLVSSVKNSPITEKESPQPSALTASAIENNASLPRLISEEISLVVERFVSMVYSLGRSLISRIVI